MKKSILYLRKIPLTMLLVLVISVVMVSMGPVSSVPTITQTNSTTTVYLDPPTINGTAIGVNNTVTVNITISNAQEVNNWRAGLTFNPDLLECTGFFEGEFLSDVGETLWQAGTIDNTQGVVTAGYATFKAVLGTYRANGTGQLAYLTFKVKAPGVSDLHLRDVNVDKVVWKEEPLPAWYLEHVFPHVIDVYTVLWDTAHYTVVTVTNSTGKIDPYVGEIHDHAFNPSNKEISFYVTQPSPSWPIWTGFSNVSIPKTLLSVHNLDDWIVIMDDTPLSTGKRIVTDNGTHFSIYFTYGRGDHKIQIIGTYVPFLSDLVASLEAPPFLRLGFSSLLNATVYNVGENNETDVELQLLINGTIVNSTVISFLEVGHNYTFSYLWKPPAVEATYNVTAYVTPKMGEKVTSNNVETKSVLVRKFYIFVTPDSGPIGTKVTVIGEWFSAQTQMLVTFNDVLVGYTMTDEFGAFTFVFNVPVSVAGIQTVKAFEATNLSNYAEWIFTVVDVTPLDIEIDVGTIYFRGELAEFYIQTSFKGVAVNATSISAILYKPDGTTESLTVPPPIATGFYKLPYSLPVDAQNGTYALAIEASYITDTIESHGTAFKAFLLSSTLAEELALVQNLGDEIENLKAQISALNTTLNSLNQKITQLETDLLAEIAALNTTLNSLNEATTQLETRVNTIKGAQEAFSPPLYAAVVLALIAAVGAVFTIFLRRKPTP